jgi:hypothetical protein
MNAATAAVPLAMCVSQFAAQFGSPQTGSVDYVVYTAVQPQRDAMTGTTASVDSFRLSLEELAKFHELNINPPSVGTEVIEIFKAKLAQD